MINRYYHKIINGALKKLCEYLHKWDDGWVCSRCGVRKADTDAFQIASRWNSNNIFYRRKQNDTWEPWVELYPSGNEAPSP